MKKAVIIILLIFFTCATNLFSFDFPAYSPIDIEELVEYFETISNNNPPGVSFFDNRAVRIRANYLNPPAELNENDIANLRSTLRSLGIHPDNASQFGYKVEYTFPSAVDWQKETKLVFFIQNVQRPYFERDFEKNDTIYWFAVYRQFNTFSQVGYFVVSVFLNERYFIEYGIE
ncbi:MAG: hypothetical protein FWD47_13120 [Treponema sp.]|nr:hypothetical protein [Treponema sp.]